MVETPSPVAFLGLPLWVGPPVLLIIMVTRLRVVRITFSVGLVVALTFLFAIACQLLQGQGLPNWIEGLVLWGPTTLAVCAAALLTDRWLSRRRDSGAHLESGQTGRGLVAGRSAAGLLTAAFVAWSAFCGCCVFSPAAAAVDLRLDSPTPGLVLPMPKDLTLVSADRDCGSEMCSEIYLIGSPDQARLQELTDRLWTHLVATKGWERRRDDAGCQRPGWFLRNEFCLFVDVERTEPVAVLRVHVTGDLTVASPRRAAAYRWAREIMEFHDASQLAWPTASASACNRNRMRRRTPDHRALSTCTRGRHADQPPSSTATTHRTRPSPSSTA